ncbi:Hypothetical protein FKW44_008933, partial [Caligus rogercresseyi]
ASLGRKPTGARFRPPCEITAREGDDSDGVHLQAEAGIDHDCTTCRDPADGNTMKVPEDDWQALSQPEKRTRSG